MKRNCFAQAQKDASTEFNPKSVERYINLVNFIMGLLVIIASLAVSVPLTIKVFRGGGGTWGFGIIGFPILISLSLYCLLGITALVTSGRYQRIVFVITHFILFGASAIVMFLFPVYPTLLVSFSLVLAVAGLISYSRYRYYLLFMLLLTLIANVVLVKWEVDFHRTLPILQLFE